MKFLTTGEKVRKLREQLNIKQEDLVSERVTRGLISMIETGRREVSYKTGVRLAEKFNEKAEEINIIMNIDEAYLMRSPGEDAEIYCLNKLKNEDITKSTIDEIFEIINQYDLLFVQAKTYVKIGQLSSNRRDFGEAIINYDKAINIYKSMGKSEELGYIYLKMGGCKANNFKYDAAIVYYNLSQYYSFAHDDKETQKVCLYGLANSYKYLNEIDLALETIEKYLSVASETDFYYNYGLNIKASCYEAKENYDKAIDIYKSLLEKISDNENPILGYVYNNLGLNYCHKNDFKESLKYFEMAEKFKFEVDKKNVSHSLIEKSIVFLKQNLNDDAIKTIEIGLKYAKEYNDVEYLIKGNYILADIYDKQSENENLERTYISLIELINTSKEWNKLVSVYVKLALMYLKQDKVSLCEKYLLLSKNLNK